MYDIALPFAVVLALGLMVGSFLNVVIHRLPLMMQAEWAGDDAAQPHPVPTFNLAWPSSHCPHCHHRLCWRENIPVLSFLVLRGQCAHCKTPISWRYPIIELITAGLFLWIFEQHGWSFSALAWAGFASALVTLAAIDADTYLLPDAITQPLVWSGLLAASMDLSSITLYDALWGAAAGYLFLWSVYWLFKVITGKEGMGQGDFKLMAALGAWLGWPTLLSLVLIASFSGVLGGIGLKLRNHLPENGELPFGPFLVFAGLWVMAIGPLPWFLI